MNKDIKEGLAWGGSMLVVALCASFARKMGYLDNDAVLRIVIGMNGLLVAWYGNRMPKTFVPNAHARKARYVAGWSQVLSGLLYTGLWVFAPIQLAVAGGTAAILTGIAVTFGYCLSLRSKPKATA